MEDRIRHLEEQLANALERIETLKDQIKLALEGVHGLDRRTVGMIKMGGPLNRGAKTCSLRTQEAKDE